MKEVTEMTDHHFTPQQRRLFGTQLVVQGSAIVALVVLLIKIVDSNFQLLTGRLLLAMLAIIIVQWGLSAVISSFQKRLGEPTGTNKLRLSRLSASFELALFLVLGIYFLFQR